MTSIRRNMVVRLMKTNFWYLRQGGKRQQEKIAKKGVRRIKRRERGSG